MRWQRLWVIIFTLLLGACAPQAAPKAEIVLPADCVVTNLHLEAISTHEISSIKMTDSFWHVFRMNWYYVDSDVFIVHAPAEVKPKAAVHNSRLDSGFPEGIVACETEQSAKDYMAELLER